MVLWNVTWHVSNIKQRKLLEVLTEALEFKPEAFDLLGGGSRIRCVASWLKQKGKVATKDAETGRLGAAKWLKFKINDQQVQFGPTGPLSLWKALDLIAFGW